MMANLIQPITKHRVDDFARRMEALKDPRKRRGFIQSFHASIVQKKVKFIDNDARTSFAGIESRYGFPNHARKIMENDSCCYGASDQELQEKIDSIVKSLQQHLHASQMEIPIKNVVKLEYSTGSETVGFKALIAPTVKQPLIFFEAGSQHGMLALVNWRIFTNPDKSDFLSRMRLEGVETAGYKRNGERTISAIYLDPKDAVKAAYLGTLEDLMKIPGMRLSSI